MCTHFDCSLQWLPWLLWLNLVDLFILHLSGARCRPTTPAVTVHSPVIPLLSKHKKHRHHTETCPVSTDKLHHSSTRFFRMISRTSAVTSCRMLSMVSSVRQNRTTFPSGFTRNFQKFHFGIFCAESETQHTTRYTCTRLSAFNL